MSWIEHKSIYLFAQGHLPSAFKLQSSLQDERIPDDDEILEVGCFHCCTERLRNLVQQWGDLLHGQVQGYGYQSMMKVKWRIVLAVVALFLTSGCSQGSISSAISSSTPIPSTSASIDRSIVYTEAAVYLQSFLDSWKKIGFYAAGQKYFNSSSRSQIQRQRNPVLISGKVTLMQPYAWVSADHFKVLVSVDLRFSKKDAGTWGNGINDLFVTFVRSSASTPYQITLATGP